MQVICIAVSCDQNFVTLPRFFNELQADFMHLLRCNIFAGREGLNILIEVSTFHFAVTFLSYNDASKPESFITMVEDVIKASGRIDVLVNNFGTSKPGQDLDFSNTDTEVFLDTVNINLRSVFAGSKQAVKYMAKQGGGSIINISSVGGIVPDISQVAYGTSKAAINYLTKLIAVHEAKNNIRCNAVLPGMTATEAVEKNLSDNFKNVFLRHIPLRRMGEPDEIAKATVYFASDDSAYTTGQILTVAGGFGMATPLYADLSDKLNRR